MAITRQSKTIITGVTRDAAEEAFANYNRSFSDLQVIEGKMNNEITTVKEKYESSIGKLQKERDENFEVIQAYAEASPELFEDKKSVEWTHGTFGFRTGMPKLACKRGFKWPAVLSLLKKVMPEFVKVKEDIDKDGLIAQRGNESISRKFSDVGIEVVQDETFYVSPKLEAVASA